MPHSVSSGQEVILDLFFPISPSPKALYLNYLHNDKEYLVTIDIQRFLDGLHMPDKEAEVFLTPTRKQYRRNIKLIGDNVNIGDLVNEIKIGIGSLIKKIATIIILALILISCTINPYVKDPKSIDTQAVLSKVADDNVQISLDWLITRNSPNSWFRNANWDEYQVSVLNMSEGDIQLKGFVIKDSLGTDIQSTDQYSELVKQTRAMIKRYKKEGKKIRSGKGVKFNYWSLITPHTLALGGIFYLDRLGILQRKISDKSSDIPALVAKDETMDVGLFFPITPSPQAITMTYELNGEEHQIALDTSKLLQGINSPSE